MPKFTNENWGQAFRMYCNTSAWGYNPTYKQSGKKHTVTWEKDNEQNKTKHSQRIKAVIQLSFFTAKHKQDCVCGTREARKHEQESGMMTMISAIVNFFTPVSRQQIVEKYLAESESLYDLERRQRELQRKGIYQHD